MPKHNYHSSETEITYHQDDNVLHNITVKLPKQPAFKEIDGYGEYPKNQKFKYTEIPPRLQSLIKESENIDDIWDKLNTQRNNYEEEIEFIRREWDRRLNGYWFFNNGKATYIDGWHYFYLNYWSIDIGHPDYRDRDRRWFIFVRYAYTTTEAYYPFRVLDIKSEKVLGYFATEKQANMFRQEKGEERTKTEQGDFIVDMHRRTVLGVNYSKYRREGATYRAGCVNFLITSLHELAEGGIQSMHGDAAKSAFLEKVVSPWKKVPFFFMPRYSGSTNPQNRLVFDRSAKRIGGKGSLLNIGVGLESKITYADSAKAGAYDGHKLYFLNNDEIGKTIEVDVAYRHRVQKKCSMLGNSTIIFGFELNTSTVGEMSKEGGLNYFNLCKDSMWDERDNTGQTKSGLINLFFPTYDGMEGFIDIFGMSIIDDPLEEDVWKWENPLRDSSGRLMGAKRALEEKLNNILLDDNPETLAAYEEEIRQSPNQFSECFITAGEGSGLNLKKISRRIRQLQFDKSATRQGNFEWENDVLDSRVVWVDDSVNGRWHISLELNDSESNLKVQTRGLNLRGEEVDMWMPLRPWQFTASADPYAFSKTKDKRHSKGGGHVFMERDKTIDYEGRPVSEWTTYRTVATYLYRPLDPYDFAEDMLKMSVYYGAMMFPERNIAIIWNHFVNRGYGGYLKYRRKLNGTWDTSPGFYNKGEIPQKIMTLAQNYIENYIELERHIDILYQLKNIRGVNELTHYDLLVAFGGSLIGSETDYSQYYDEKDVQGKKGVDISQLFK